MARANLLLLREIFRLLDYPKQTFMPRNAKPLRSFGPDEASRALKFFGALKMDKVTAEMERCVVLDSYGIHLVESPKQEGKR